MTILLPFSLFVLLSPSMMVVSGEHSNTTNVTHSSDPVLNTTSDTATMAPTFTIGGEVDLRPITPEVPEEGTPAPSEEVSMENSAMETMLDTEAETMFETMAETPAETVGETMEDTPMETVMETTIVPSEVDVVEVEDSNNMTSGLDELLDLEETDPPMTTTPNSTNDEILDEIEDLLNQTTDPPVPPETEIPVEEDEPTEEPIVPVTDATEAPTVAPSATLAPGVCSVVRNADDAVCAELVGGTTALCDCYNFCSGTLIGCWDFGERNQFTCTGDIVAGCTRDQLSATALGSSSAVLIHFNAALALTFLSCVAALAIL